MSKSLRCATFSVAALLSSGVLQAESGQPFRFADGDRVVLLGDTFFERAQRYGWLETALQRRFPNENLQFRNLGWSGDTVFAESRGIFDPPATGYARMLEQIRDLKPTVILLNYGGNESFNGPDYRDTFIRQYDKLLDDLSSTKARVVLVSPLPLVDAGSPLPKPAGQNLIRKQFVNAVQKLAKDRTLHFVDMWSPIEQHLDDFGSDFLTPDGIHLTGYGYSIVSTILARTLAGDPVSMTPQVKLGNTAAEFDGYGIQQDDYEASASSRRLQATLSENSATIGIRISADQLNPGKYELRSNDEFCCELTSDQLNRSALSDHGSIAMLDVEELRQTIVQKNEMYFYRWRPQNVTYLFLFRKHEQGNNAKEVDEFLPIIARLETRIHELKSQPRKLNIEIVAKPPAGN
ncbi:MAG: SGNH/GDSL hydrolase family protein [Planctomycetota bacterium]|nr:SGNH/GDSL hydrolase family protein [Planctomycetota bacterium]